MLKLVGSDIYLSVLEKEHCRHVWEEFEYDFEAKTEPLHIGHSVCKAESWFDEIQKVTLCFLLIINANRKSPNLSLVKRTIEITSAKGDDTWLAIDLEHHLYF